MDKLELTSDSPRFIPWEEHALLWKAKTKLEKYNDTLPKDKTKRYAIAAAAFIILFSSVLLVYFLGRPKRAGTQRSIIEKLNEEGEDIIVAEVGLLRYNYEELE